MDRLLEAFASLPQGFEDVLLAMPGAEIAALATPAEHEPVVALDVAGPGVVATYTLVKQLAERFGYRQLACVAVGNADEDTARANFTRVAAAADHFLGTTVRWAGWMPPPAHERAAHEAACTAHALLHPDSEAAAVAG